MIGTIKNFNFESLFILNTFALVVTSYCFNNPDSNNEISQIKKYFKFPLSNKVFKYASLCIILYIERNPHGFK